MTVNKYCYVCKQVKRSAGNTSTTCLYCEAVGVKYCASCNTTKPLEQFEQRRTKVGSTCKACKNAKQNKRYKTDESFKQGMLQSARQYSNNRYATDEDFRASEQVRKQLRRALGSLTTKEWQNICERYNYSCAYCGEQTNLTIEHIVPILMGGKTNAANIVPACQSCNSSKQSSDLVEWYTKQSFYSKEKLGRIIKQLKGGDAKCLI